MENTIYTIGYGGRNRDEFIDLLKSYKIETIVDVRLRPDRASMGIWVRSKTSDKGIEKWLKEAGINYVSLIELGNIFLEFSDWESRYKLMLETNGDLLTERLIGLTGRIELLCAEKDPAFCHRRLIADYLAKKRGIEIHHII